MLAVQRWFGYLCLLPLYSIIVVLLRIGRKYSILNLREVRSKFSELCNSGKPLLVCSNHLTLIDSVILLWAFSSPFGYLKNYRYFCWNFPAKENTKKHLLWRIITFASKCILIDRTGSQDHTKEVLNQAQKLLNAGDSIMIFPEGTRSRTGFVSMDHFNYGVGKILQSVSFCNVVCVYLRGLAQSTYSDFPKKGERFKIDLKVIEVPTGGTGLRAARELAKSIMHEIYRMEQAFFETITTQPAE